MASGFNTSTPGADEGRRVDAGMRYISNVPGYSSSSEEATSPED